MYKWHRGYRRDINGRYIKVSVSKNLKLFFSHQPKEKKMLLRPCFFEVTTVQECQGKIFDF